MAAVIVPFKSRRHPAHPGRTRRREPTGAEVTDVVVQEFLAEARVRCHAERRGALLVECPHARCIAAVGESCESESGRPRSPHVGRLAKWSALPPVEQATLAGLAALREAQQEEDR